MHFVVQEIIRTEGAHLSGTSQNPDDAKCRKLGLQVVSGLSSELTSVKKSAAMDSDVLSSDVSKLSRAKLDISLSWPFQFSSWGSSCASGNTYSGSGYIQF